MRVSEYADLDAVALAALVRRGEVTPAELAATARAATEAVNGALNALAFPLYGEPLASAPDGPFAAVPVLIKDTGVAGGVTVSVGSRFLDGRVVPGDADIMARFRAAGLAAIGCTAVPELAISFATESVRGGITRNPWDLARGAGGSSGGAAALVAARAVPVAHGNDGAGSIRGPAAACGLVGLKPTRGRAGPAAWHAALRRREPHDGELAGVDLRGRAVHRGVQHQRPPGDQPAARPDRGAGAGGRAGRRRYGREDVLFRVAAQLEQALPWADRRPPVCAG